MANERKRLKMIDVARAAGVSATTVSRVLAGVEGASSEETASAIRQAASELGYVVNGVASGLRSQQTRTVGLVLADVGNPFFGQVASGVENTLSAAGYSVILVNTNNSIEQEKQLVRVLIEKRVDALVVATSAKSGDHIREAVDGGMQVVLVDSELPDIRGDSVVIDNAAVAQTAVQHLLDLGADPLTAQVQEKLGAIFERELQVFLATEAGTCYRPSEVAEIAEAGRRYGMRLHMDGARFANAVQFLGVSPAEMITTGANAYVAVRGPILLEWEMRYADRAIQFRQEFEDQSFHDRRADAAAPGPKTPPLSFT